MTETQQTAGLLTGKQKGLIYGLITRTNKLGEGVESDLLRMFNKKTVDELTVREASTYIDALQADQDKKFKAKVEQVSGKSAEKPSDKPTEPEKPQIDETERIFLGNRMILERSLKDFRETYGEIKTLEDRLIFDGFHKSNTQKITAYQTIKLAERKKI